MVRRFLALSLFVCASIPTAAFAAPARELTVPLRKALETMPQDGKTVLRDVALGRGKLDTIELEPMQVWAKDAKVVVFGADGQQTTLPPPAVKYFKGRVQGEDDSMVFFSMSGDGTIRGLVTIGERRWNVGSGVPKVRREGRRERGADFAPILIGEMDVVDDVNDPANDWQCYIDQQKGGALKAHRPGLTADAKSDNPTTHAGDVAGASYQLRIAIETDNEFCAAFGNNATSISTYIGDLVAKASIVYSRDLGTTLFLGHVNVRNGGAGTDPWTVAASTNFFALQQALAEFGTHWHNNFPQSTHPRSSAVFLSGRLFSGGFAWFFNFLCSDDFYCGDNGEFCGGSPYEGKFAGSYAFNGSSQFVETSVPDPTATVNGVEFGLPQANYWMLLEFMHELGHNINGQHTQCVALTPAEKTLYSTSRNFVDECYNRDGAGCFSGTTPNCNLLNDQNADPFCDAPPEKGTIMSYCHNIFSGQFRQSRYLFGKSGEPSFKMLGLFNDEIELATPNPTITAQSEPVACSADRTASVGTCTGCTFDWEITGGTITSGDGTSSITYTPNAASVTLTVTVVTARGCGITASKTIATSCGAVSAPANVVATATSTTVVNVMWTASEGAASYNVYRSSDGINYALAGSTTAPTTAFNDTGRSADTAYLYKVRAVNGGESPDSNRDLATTTIFTDDPLVALTTTVKAAHFNELRTAIDAVRTLAALGGGSYTGGTLSGGDVTQILAVHITDRRTALDAARSMLSLPAITYGETITAGTTAIDDSHIAELRNGVK